MRAAVVANQANLIHEAATYKDADIEHTSTHITVTHLESKRQVRLTNDELTSFSVRQLNKIVQGFPRQTITKLKQRRRTLKNRGYAQNCRHKRLDQKNKLERQNESLRQEVNRQARLISELREKVHNYSVRLHQQHQQLQEHSMQQGLFHARTRDNHGDEPAQPTNGGDRRQPLSLESG